MFALIPDRRFPAQFADHKIHGYIFAGMIFGVADEGTLGGVVFHVIAVDQEELPDDEIEYSLAQLELIIAILSIRLATWNETITK